MCFERLSDQWISCIELEDEPELAVDVSGFEYTLPNIGAYDMKALPELDLELQDDDAPEIITGNTSTLDDDEEGDDDEGMDGFYLDKQH